MSEPAFLQLAQQIALLKQQLELSGALAASPGLLLDQSGFLDYQVSLTQSATNDITGSGVQIPLEGYEVSYLRRVSTPGGLLQIAIGGLTQPFAPGDRLAAHFKGLLVKLAPGSVAGGTAWLRIALQPQARFREFQGDNINVAPVNLLGSLSPSGAVTFITEAKDTDPSGAAPAGSFSCSGWKKILLLIDTTSAAGTATTFDLVPWYQPPGTTLASAPWFEQGTQTVSVPDTAVSGGQFRVVEWNLTGAQGQMYFAIRNLLALARTGLQFAVIGIG